MPAAASSLVVRACATKPAMSTCVDDASLQSHGGGTLPYLVGRFEKGDQVEIPSRRRMKRKPTDYLRHIYYDCITYNLGALQYLISVVGADRVMFGTDWPHQVHDTKGAFANTARLPEGQTSAVRSGNAQRIFRL